VMRLLFVDDEPRVLQGLRQSLRNRRNEWDMVFVEGAERALAELEGGPFDAVISDMRMPSIDGAELLDRVREAQPQALRVVLSGQMDEQTAARAAASAHRFLAKPCETDVLVETIRRALELRARLCSKRMLACIGGMSRLPSLPESCASLNRALADEGVPLTEVARIIEADSGMATKVLQLVNSAFFGLSRRVSSIFDAVQYLGLNAIRSLLLAHALFEELGGDRVTGLAVEQSRALLAARFARRFALERRPLEVAVTAAMLHNVGRLALIACLPSEHHANLAHAEAEGTSVEEAERARLGVTHAEIGAYLLGLWGLPHEVVEAVAFHHLPLRDRSVLDPGAVVQLAEALVAEALGQGPREIQEIPEEELTRLGVASLMASLRAELGADPSGRGPR
jgi:HD-like signal output (HDOD) protein/CheY-like chemotaxis protein